MLRRLRFRRGSRLDSQLVHTSSADATITSAALSAAKTTAAATTFAPTARTTAAATTFALTPGSTSNARGTIEHRQDAAGGVAADATESSSLVGSLRTKL